MSQPTPTPPPPFIPTSSPKFDQVVEGNVDIKQLSKKKYKITVSEISKFLKYQVWSASSKKLNEERSVFYQKANKWIKNFNSLNAALKASNKPLFTPTTVMEIDDNKYVFVIDKAKLKKSHKDHNDHKDDKDHVVFTVSTKEIESSEKKLLKLPSGKHDGVRFDVDSESLEQIIFPVGSNMFLIGAVIGDVFVNWKLLGNYNNSINGVTNVYVLWSTLYDISVTTKYYSGKNQYLFVETIAASGTGVEIIFVPTTLSLQENYPNIYNLIMVGGYQHDFYS